MLTFLFIGLLAGISATPHCLGMCGGFSLHLAKDSGRGASALRLGLFVAGKSFTYVFLGALAASLGVIVFKNTALAPGAVGLRIAAGILTVLIGAAMLGARLPRIKAIEGAEVGFMRRLFGGFLARPGPLSAFLLGLGVGFLPCPLPLGMLAVAASSHHALFGMALMAGIGLGTAPGLLAVGLFGIGLDRRMTKIGMRAAGTLVILLGLLTLARATGVVAPRHPVNRVVPSCFGR